MTNRERLDKQIADRMGETVHVKRLEALYLLADAYPDSYEIQQFIELQVWRLYDEQSNYGQPIEAYIAEVFPEVKDIRSAEYPYRTFGVGFRIAHHSTKTVSEVCEWLVRQTLMDLQFTFGAARRRETFYWRERPRITVWRDMEMNATCVGLWLAFWVEGWKHGQSLQEFVGQETSGVMRRPIEEFEAIPFVLGEDYKP